MRYIKNKNYGSNILGIYDTFEEAKEIIDMYALNCSITTILEIQRVKKNIKIENLEKIKPYTNSDGDNFIKVGRTIYENQEEYFLKNNYLSKTFYDIQINK